MSARELLRRVGLWSGVAVYGVGVGIAIWMAQSLGTSTILHWTTLGFALWPVVGAIILTRQPRNGVGWFLWAIGPGMALGIWTLVPEFVASWPAWLESLRNAGSGAAWPVLAVIGLLFPTGRIETRLGRVLAWLLAAFTLLGIVLPALLNPAPLPSGQPNPAGIAAFAWLNEVPIGVPTIAGIAIVAGIILDLARRWRRAGIVERLQYRWFVYGFSLVVALLVAYTVSIMVAPEGIVGRALQVLSPFVYSAVPISIGIAVTRHGLYSVGRVISRTVAYAIVTIAAVGVYVVIVTSISLLLPGQNAVAVALATLAGAAVFLPVLRRVQRWLDRRFDRERYDATRVVDAFGARLRVEVDPATTAPDLVHAVEQTLQPVTIGLWTRAEPR